MLPRSSFKAELETFRENLKPPRKPGDRGPLGIGSRNTADRQLLDRWVEDDRADGIWHKLKKHTPDADPAAFIKAVLAARRSAVASVNRSRSFKAEWDAVVATLTKRLLQAPLSAERLDALFDDTAQRFRDLHRFYFGFADHAKFELSRKGQKRVRTLFMQILGSYFTEQFGRQFDKEVAALTEIALAEGANLISDHVINIRRHRRRPLTRQKAAK
jgi:hypothetical protein